MVDEIFDITEENLGPSEEVRKELIRVNREKQNKRRFVTREKGKRYDRCIGVFDIETDGLGGEFLDSVVLDSLQGEAERYRTIDEMFTRLMNPIRPLKKNGKPKKCAFNWFAHNGSGYDFLYIAKMLIAFAKTQKIECETVQQGDKIIGVIIPTEQGKIILRDTYPLLQSDLKSASKAFAPDYMKKDIGLSKGVIYDPDNPVHVDYMKQDAYALMAVYLAYEDKMFEYFGVGPGWTAGGTAMKAWKATIPAGHVYYREHPNKEAFARQAYYGGYVYPGETTEVHLERGVTYDRSAAYAAAMKSGVPVGVGKWTCDYEITPAGFWHVIVHAPNDTPFPIIPYRDKTGLQWRVGTFEAYTTTNEIEFAKQHGYTFEIIKGLVYDKLEAVHGEFTTRCEKLEYPEDGIKDPTKKAIAKNMRNSLYGKFATRENIEKLVIAEDMQPDSGYKPLMDKVTGELIEDIWVIDEMVDADYINPHWAAYITMWQRLYMLKLAYKIGRGKVWYMDTDSITAEREIILKLVRTKEIPTDIGYGNFHIEKDWIWFCAMAPKLYDGELIEDGKVIHYAKAKGIPASALKKYRAALALARKGKFVDIPFDSLNSFKHTLCHPEDEFKQKRKRKITNIQNSQSWIVIRNSIKPAGYEDEKAQVPCLQNASA